MLIFCLLFQSCSATLSNWERSPEDPDRLARYSHAQKQRYYKHYGIHTLKRGDSDAIALSTYADPNIFYKLDSFMPLLNQKVSDTRWYLDKVERLENFDNMLWGGYLLGTLFYVITEVIVSGPPSERNSQRYNFFNIVGISGLVGLSLSSQSIKNQQNKALKTLKEKYNRQLLKELDLTYSYP